MKPYFGVSPRKPATKSPRIIPWGWLVGVLLIYLLIGYFLAASNAGYIFWAMAVAGAGAWAWAGAGTVAGAVAGAVAVAMAGAVAWAVAVAMAGVGAWAVAGAMAGAGAWAWAVAGAGEKLRKSFSEFHTFLILARTSSLGFALGWLGRILTILN